MNHVRRKNPYAKINSFKKLENTSRTAILMMSCLNFFEVRDFLQHIYI